MSHVELGRIGAPFGVRGWVHVDAWTDPPERLVEYSPWQLRLPNGARLERRVAESRLQGAGMVARLDGVGDRDAAAALTGAVVEVERAALPPPGEREYYRSDLLGFAVQNLEGAELGTVAHFLEAPTGPVMVVREGGREHWVLAVPRHLRKVDLAAGRILVDWPAELE